MMKSATVTSNSMGRRRSDGRRSRTAIPVPPPRIPTPIPNSKTSVSRCPPPQPPYRNHQRANMVQMAQKYLDTNIDTWINPRIYAKIDQKAVRSPTNYVFGDKAPITKTSAIYHHDNREGEGEMVPQRSQHCCGLDVNATSSSTSSSAVHFGSQWQEEKCGMPLNTSSVVSENDNNHVRGNGEAGRLSQVKTRIPVYGTSTISSPNYKSSIPPPNYKSKLLRALSGNRVNYLNGDSTTFLKDYGRLDGVFGCETSSSLVLNEDATPTFYSANKYSCSTSRLDGAASPAAAFFARAAQKLNLSSSAHWKKRESYHEPSGVGFSGVLHRSPPPVPPALLRRIDVREVNGIGKVKVMLRVCGAPGESTTQCPSNGPSNGTGDGPSNGTATNGPNSSSFFNVDVRRKQVTLFDPAACGGSSTPEDRRVGVAAPKMFAFDALFTQDDPQSEICSSALTDVIHAVINGNDGCLFCYGHARLGKTHTMVGTPETLGVIPCAISWLFRGITEQKQKTGARFSVRVSAVEVGGTPGPHLRDLLTVHANDCEQSPGVFLRDDPLFETHLQNQVELRVPTADKAAFYLDAALSSRSLEEGHLLYTLHVYQYSVGGKGGVAGGRSRLHLIDLGSCEKGKANGGIPLSGIGNVLLAIFNGQKHLPYREHKLTQLLKECLSSLTCHSAMIAHVSPYAQHYTDTLATVQLASRIHRMRRRKIKFNGGSTGSGGSSGEEAGRYQENRRSPASSDVDPSSSEQSADTVIYVGPSDDATDGEHPPVYIPSMNSGDNRCVMSKALRGSGIEHRLHHKLPIPQKSPKSSLEGSPVHHSVKNTVLSGKPPISSSKSPVRSLKTNSKVLVGKDQDMPGSPSKVPISIGSVNTSDEQWIDGPRISKSKVAEARSLLKKKETWIDGPLQTESSTAVAASANGHPSATAYGFMDNHKKTMIRKWVENQSVQSPRTGNVKHLAQRPPTTGGSAPSQQPYKEMTVFKTSKEDTDEILVIEMSQRLEDADGAEAKVETAQVVESGTEKQTEFVEEEEEDGVGDIPPPLQLLHPQSQEITSANGVNDYPMCLIDPRTCTDLDDNEVDDEDIDIIIEDETREPVPMQDSCLQVTEEDIAFCMGEMENPLPEVDQESIEEHPLRILSQENLTIVSTFADTISVSSEGKHRYSFYEQEDRFQQLARLHEMYKNKLARSSVSPFRQSPSRCQSVSLTDMHHHGECNEGGQTSIFKAPAFTYGDKICDHCKMSIRGNGLWNKPLNCNISSLRHPDGASNPNLKEEVERIPGNGASVSDHEEDIIPQIKKGSGDTHQQPSSDVRTVTGRSEEDDEEDIATVPPPLSVPSPLRIHTARYLNKSPAKEQYALCDDVLHARKAMRKDVTNSASHHRHRSAFSRRECKDVSCSPIHQKHGHCQKNSVRPRRSSNTDGCADSSRESTSKCSSLTSTKDLHQVPMPVLQYCREDVERLERRWTEVHGGRIAELQSEQMELKAELAAAKTRLLIPADRWSFELHVAACTSKRDRSYIEALEKETLILRKRVVACKYHILMVTCFDTKLHRGAGEGNADTAEARGSVQVPHTYGHMF